MAAIAIIPARGGSRRIKNKNRRPFFGKPIIAYSIETAKASGLFERIYVSTDDQEISDVAFKWGADVIQRTPVMARDEVGTQEVMRSVLQDLVDGRALHFGSEIRREIRPPVGRYACCIYGTAPLMTVDDLREGYRILQQGGTPFVYSYGPAGDAGQWYWGRALAFGGMPLEEGTWYRIPWQRVCDINTHADFNRALDMYSRLHGIPVNPEERL